MLARCSTVKNSRCPVGTSAPVWSASETLVRRPTGPWTPAVHALLTHLYEVGFRAAPRPLGIDDQGREVLTFTQGHVIWPDRCFLLESARKPAGVAGLIRDFHDAVQGFTPPARRRRRGPCRRRCARRRRWCRRRARGNLPRGPKATATPGEAMPNTSSSAKTSGCTPCSAIDLVSDLRP